MEFKDRPPRIAEVINQHCEYSSEQNLSTLIASNCLAFWETLITEAEQNSILCAILVEKKIRILKHIVPSILGDCWEKVLATDVETFKKENDGDEFDVYKSIGMLLGRRAARKLDGFAVHMREYFVIQGGTFGHSKIFTPEWFEWFKHAAILKFFQIGEDKYD